MSELATTAVRHAVARTKLPSALIIVAYTAATNPDAERRSRVRCC